MRGNDETIPSIFYSFHIGASIVTTTGFPWAPVSTSSHGRSANRGIALAPLAATMKSIATANPCARAGNRRRFTSDSRSIDNGKCSVPYEFLRVPTIRAWPLSGPARWFNLLGTIDPSGGVGANLSALLLLLQPTLGLRDCENAIRRIDLSQPMALKISANDLDPVEASFTNLTAGQHVLELPVERSPHPLAYGRWETHPVWPRAHRLWNMSLQSLAQHVLIPWTAEFPLGRELEGKRHKPVVQERGSQLDRVSHRVAVVDARVIRKRCVFNRTSQRAVERLMRHTRVVGRCCVSDFVSEPPSLSKRVSPP